MKTTIKIHGLDIEFSDTPPTRPGAYWWRHPDEWAKPVLKEIFNPCSDVLIDRQTDRQPKDVGGLWSAPLVPVTEVADAWHEGRDHRIFEYIETDEKWWDHYCADLKAENARLCSWIDGLRVADHNKDDTRMWMGSTWLPAGHSLFIGPPKPTRKDTQ